MTVQRPRRWKDAWLRGGAGSERQSECRDVPHLCAISPLSTGQTIEIPLLRLGDASHVPRVIGADGPVSRPGASFGGIRARRRVQKNRSPPAGNVGAPSGNPRGQPGRSAGRGMCLKRDAAPKSSLGETAGKAKRWSGCPKKGRGRAVRPVFGHGIAALEAEA